MKQIIKTLLGLFITINIIAQTPIVNSFTPSSGTIGSIINIKGNHLNHLNYLKIGSTKTIIVSSNDSSINAMILPQSVTGKIIVSNINGIDSSASSFFVYAQTKYPIVQQGNKITGSNTLFGQSIDVSADGNTAIVGSSNSFSFFYRLNDIWQQLGSSIPTNNTPQVAISADGNTAVIGDASSSVGVWGALYVYVKSNGTWLKQGNTIVATGYAGNYNGGVSSVDISANGNVIIASNKNDNTNNLGSSVGAAWIFTRSNGIWTQQGNKLVATDLVQGTFGSVFGSSVSISADENTVSIGAAGDNNGQGATWIFSKSNGTWTQQGSKLIGTGGNIYDRQGSGISLNADGTSLAIVGSRSGNGFIWVFNKSGNNWVQDGNVFGLNGPSILGSVSITADGKTVIVGSTDDNNNVGAAYIFTRNNGNSWTQVGYKLIGKGFLGQAQQGASVSISADGTTILVGGSTDDNYKGAFWSFKQPNSISKLTVSPKKAKICKGNSVLLSIDSVASGSSLNSVLPTNLQNGLIAYYPFNGNANDESGNANNGTVNGASLTTDRFGRANKDYRFNGTNNYIQLPSSIQPNNISVGVWFKLASNATNQTIIRQRSSGFSISYSLTAWYGVTNQLRTELYKSSNNSYSNNFSKTLNDGKWHQCTFTYDSSLYSVYIDGVLEYQETNLTRLPIFYNNAGNGFCIGRDGDNANWYLNGYVDDVVIYNRAINSTETQQLYNPQANIMWSNNATTNSIIVSPSITTAYSVSLNDGVNTYTDSASVDVIAPSVSYISYTNCDSITYHSIVYYNSTNLTDTIKSIAGCDSIYNNVSITIKKSNTSTANANICSSQLPYSWNGLTFNSAGSKTAHLTNSVNCDSAATLNLIVKANYIITASVGSNGAISSNGATTLCSGNSQTYTITPNSGYYIYDVLVDGASQGSITTYTFNNVTANHTISASFTLTCQAKNSTTNKSICPSQLPYSWNGKTLTGAGTLVDTLTNTGGCDSIATLKLTIKATSKSTTNLSTCLNALPYSWNGLIFNTAGSQTAHLTNAAGCDSAATLNLTVTTQPTPPANNVCVGSTLQLTNATSGGVWSYNNNRATVNATGLVTGKSVGVATITYKVGGFTTTYNITVNALPNVPAIFYAAGAINPQRGTSSGGFCNNKTFSVVGSPSGGVFSSSNSSVVSVNCIGVVNTIANGNAALTYTYTNNVGCSNSRSISGNVVTCASRGSNNVSSNLITNEFKMYPNPARNTVTINSVYVVAGGQIVVSNLMGKQVKLQPLSLGNNVIDVTNLSKGFYLVSVITNEGKQIQKLIID
jgi:hypothetical protein